MKNIKEVILKRSLFIIICIWSPVVHAQGIAKNVQSNPSDTQCEQLGFNKLEDLGIAWSLFKGNYDNNRTMESYYTSSNYMELTTDNNVNPFYYNPSPTYFDNRLNQTITNPNGNNFVRINKVADNASYQDRGLTAMLEYTITPTNVDFNFDYAFFSVFNPIIESSESDYNQRATEFPYFKATLFVEGANSELISLNNGSFDFEEQGRIENQNLEDYGVIDSRHVYASKKWTTNSINLQDYIGQSITIRFESSYCLEGRHYSYTYLDLLCVSAEVESSETQCEQLEFTVLEDLAHAWNLFRGNYANNRTLEPYSFSPNYSELTTDNNANPFYYNPSSTYFDNRLNRTISNPNGNNFVRINKVADKTSYQDRGLTAMLEYTITPTDVNFIFDYAFFSVFNPIIYTSDSDYNQRDTEYPYFKATFFIEGANSELFSLNNGSFDFEEQGRIENQNLENYGTIDSRRVYASKEWTTNSINLQDYIGQSITIRFESSYCLEGRHFAYTYLDLTCTTPCQLTCDESLSITTCANQFVITPPLPACFDGVQVTNERWYAPNAERFDYNPPKFMYKTPGNKTIHYAVNYNDNGTSCILVMPINVTVNMCEPAQNNCCPSSFSPEPGKMYLISGWCKENVSEPVATYQGPSIKITYYLDGGELMDELYPSGLIVEEWQKIEGAILIPAFAESIEVELINNGSGEVFFDDVRFQPFNSQLKTFVYDPITKRLSAELDGNNYSTFYEYDEEGNLQRIEKETERGIQTIQEGRQNLIK